MGRAAAPPTRFHNTHCRTKLNTITDYVQFVPCARSYVYIEGTRQRVCWGVSEKSTGHAFTGPPWVPNGPPKPVEWPSEPAFEPPMSELSLEECPKTGQVRPT